MQFLNKDVLSCTHLTMLTASFNIIFPENGVDFAFAALHLKMARLKKASI